MPVLPAAAPLLQWSWIPSVVLGLVGLALAYFLLTGPLRRRFAWGPPVSTARQAAFFLGVLVVFVALCSPIDELGDEYLFSAHMAQHMLITFAAPPLWLLGIPDWAWEKLFSLARSHPRLRPLFAAALHPLAAFLVFNGVMWAWHLPGPYGAALKNEGIHIVEHLSFIAAALIGWAPALLPAQVNPLLKPVRALYLFASTFSCTALAALFTLSNRVFYPFYLAAPRAWGITALWDQQLGGLIMWLPGDSILMLAIFFILGRWLAQEERAAG